MFKPEIGKKIHGLKLLPLRRVGDERGWFLKNFSQELVEGGISLNVKESFFNCSCRNVIRGMHLQIKEAAHDKIVTLITGHILDVIVDLRIDSPSFGAVESFELVESPAAGVFIPAGCAHGFLTFAERNIIAYLTSSFHVPSLDTGIRFDSFGFTWPAEAPTISARDAALPHPDEFLKFLGAGK